MLHYIINFGQNVDCQDAILPTTLSRFQALIRPAIQGGELDVPFNTRRLETPLPSPYDLHEVKGYLTVKDGHADFELTIDSDNFDVSGMSWVVWDAAAQPAVWHEASDILRQMAQDGFIRLPAAVEMPVSSTGLASALLIDTEQALESLDESKVWLLSFSRCFALALLALLGKENFMATADGSSQV